MNAAQRNKLQALETQMILVSRIKSRLVLFFAQDLLTIIKKT